MGSAVQAGLAHICLIKNSLHFDNNSWAIYNPFHEKNGTFVVFCTRISFCMCNHTHTSAKMRKMFFACCMFENITEA